MVGNVRELMEWNDWGFKVEWRFVGEGELWFCVVHVPLGNLLTSCSKHIPGHLEDPEIQREASDMHITLSQSYRS